MIYALIAILLLQVLDGYSTYRILRNGGVEYNPVLRWLITKLGVVATMVITKSFVAAVAVGLFIIHSDAVYLGVVLYLAIVGNNLYQWSKQ